MLNTATKKIKLANFFLVLATLAFLTVGTLGMSHTLGMEKKANGRMGGCLFTGLNEICPMSFGEHLTRWQSMFANISLKSGMFSLAISVFALFVSVLVSLKRYFSQKLFLRHHQNLFIFNPLREAFSQGILNPKTF
jgi:FtsH-binding integral membrane protein